VDGWTYHKNSVWLNSPATDDKLFLKLKIRIRDSACSCSADRMEDLTEERAVPSQKVQMLCDNKELSWRRGLRG
jgi:hypothetical protein